MDCGTGVRHQCGRQGQPLYRPLIRQQAHSNHPPLQPLPSLAWLRSLTLPSASEVATQSEPGLAAAPVTDTNGGNDDGLEATMTDSGETGSPACATTNAQVSYAHICDYPDVNCKQDECKNTDGCCMAAIPMRRLMN